MADVDVDGIPFRIHRQKFPERYTITRRAWPVFWQSWFFIPLTAGLNWLQNDPWSAIDTGICIGFILGRFFIALDPPEKEVTTTYRLDHVPLHKRIWRSIRGDA